MATYRKTNEAGDVLATSQLGKPTPKHALTKAAERARQSVRDLPPQRIVHDNGVVKLTRKPLTRAEVVAAYVHPAPEKSYVAYGWRVLEPDWSDRAVAFATTVRDELGAEVKVTVARGTTPPRWRVPADTPVDPADYRGDVVDSVVVWARQTSQGREIRVRAEWHDGRIHKVELNDAASTLKAALEALRGEA